MISSAADFVEGLAKAIGPSFGTYFKSFWPHISKYYSSEKLTAERSMAIGIIGGVIEGIQQEVTPLTNVKYILILAINEYFNGGSC